MDNPQDNIISLLGLEDLPIENRAQLVDELTQILEVRVLSSAYDTLSEDQAQHLDSLLNDNNPELVTTFIQENVPNLSEIYQKMGVLYLHRQHQVMQNEQDFCETLYNDSVKLNDLITVSGHTVFIHC